jgi:hypothetical protein
MASCVNCDATPTEGIDIMDNRHEISIRSVVLTPAGGGRRVSLFISMGPWDMPCEYGIGCVT